MTNDAKLVTKPRHMVRIPHNAVKSGSHIFGDIFFNTRLDGISLYSCQSTFRHPLLGNPYLAIYVA